MVALTRAAPPVSLDDSTFAEYCRLRVECGYEAEHAMIRKVWDGCSANAQENMLEQFRRLLRVRDCYVETHGEVW